MTIYFVFKFARYKHIELRIIFCLDFEIVLNKSYVKIPSSGNSLVIVDYRLPPFVNFLCTFTYFDKSLSEKCIIKNYDFVTK